MIGICGLAIGFSIGVNEDNQSAHDHSEQDFISGIESETTYQVEGYELVSTSKSMLLSRTIGL